MEMTGGPNALTDSELERLQICEEEIEQREHASMWMGRPLREIRDKRLYREGGETWGTYTQRRWRRTKQSADRYIKAVEIAEDLAAAGLPVPCSEKQARALGRLSREKRYEVARGLQATGGFEGVAATAVETLAEEIAPRVPSEVVVGREAALVVVTTGGRVGPSTRAKGAILRSLETMATEANRIQTLGSHAVEDTVRALSPEEVQAARDWMKAILRAGTRFSSALAIHHGIEEIGQQELPTAA